MGKSVPVKRPCGGGVALHHANLFMLEDPKANPPECPPQFPQMNHPMSTPVPPNTVLITDYAWPDVEIERQIIEGAGTRLVAGPAEPASAAVIENLVREHQPSAILTNWA